jgi:hypothetical protein
MELSWNVVTVSDCHTHLLLVYDNVSVCNHYNHTYCNGKTQHYKHKGKTRTTVNRKNFALCYFRGLPTWSKFKQFYFRDVRDLKKIWTKMCSVLIFLIFCNGKAKLKILFNIRSGLFSQMAFNRENSEYFPVYSNDKTKQLGNSKTRAVYSFWISCLTSNCHAVQIPNLVMENGS